MSLGNAQLASYSHSMIHACANNYYDFWFRFSFMALAIMHGVSLPLIELMGPSKSRDLVYFDISLEGHLFLSDSLDLCVPVLCKKNNN